MAQLSSRPAAQALVLTQEAPAAAPDEGYALLDALLAAHGEAPEPGRAERFLRESDPARALAVWLGPGFAAGADFKGRLARRLSRDIARLDELLSGQVNAILHHPRFQRLEASWRGLHYLVEQVPEGENIKVKALSLTFDELKKDLLYAIEFDQSETFKKVYSAEFDMPGGEPYGALVGDFTFTNHPEHIEVLGKMAGVAAAAFAPFVAAADPKLLDLKSFIDLERPLNLPGIFEQTPYIKWRALRRHEDARFLALTLPHVLLRAPYRDEGHRVDGFRFKEEVGAPDRRDYLWGNAAYAFGGVLVRTFASTGWLADIRGVRRGEEGGGLVTGLPDCSFATDRRRLVPRAPTDVIITDALERELADLGFLPLCWLQDTDLAAFNSTQSIQAAKGYHQQEATVNARMSAMLQYVLCAARFAHYIKVIARDRLGSFVELSRFEDDLHRWLLQYTNASDSADLEMKANHPLREARVEMAEVPGQPGAFDCKIFLRPQFQLDHLVGSIQLQTRLASGAVR